MTPAPSPATSDRPSAPLRVGVIGCGAIGQRRHIPEAFANSHVALVALSDVLPGRAAEVGAAFGAPTPYLDHKQMLAKERLDVVVVGTPNAFHAQQTIDALNAGAHVLVEKPMAATLDEANAMIAAAEKNGRKLMVGQNQRLMPPHVKAKQILDSGVLGKVLNFQTTFKHGGPEHWSVDGIKSWFFRKAPAAMGVCGDLGVHKVDLMTYLIGQRITEVTGFISTQNKTFEDGATPIEVDDTAILAVRTERGVVGSITVTWTNYGRFEDNGTMIFCERGVLDIANDTQFNVVVRFNNGTSEHYKTGAVATNAQQTNSGMIDALVDAIRHDRPPIIDGPDALRSLKVILGAFESSTSGRTVKL